MPSSDLRPTDPPWASAMCRTIASPSPALPPSSLRIPLPCTRSVDLVEPLEDPLLVAPRHADAVVGDRKADHVVGRSQPIRTSPPGWLYFTALCARLRVPARAAPGPPVPARPVRHATGVVRSDLLGRRPVRSEQRCRRQPRRGRVARARALVSPGLDHRQVEELVDELGKVIGLALDLGREVARRRVVVDRSGGQRLGEELDRGERRSQLVADVRHEVAPDALDSAQRGDVVERHHEATSSSGTASTENWRVPQVGRDPPRR